MLFVESYSISPTHRHLECMKLTTSSDHWQYSGTNYKIVKVLLSITHIVNEHDLSCQ